MKGLEVSPRGFCQEELVQSEVGHRTSLPLVLFLQCLQAGKLRPLHSTIKFPPPVKCLPRDTDLANSLGNRRTLTLQYFNLPKLRYNLFGLLTFSSRR